MVRQNCADGKVSKEFIKLLRYLQEYRTRHRNFRIILFDPSHYPGGFSWNIRDRYMARTILKAQQNLDITKPILIGTGNLHSKQEIFTLKGKTLRPFGHYIKNKKTLFVEFKYLSGSYFNMTKKVIPSKLLKSTPHFMLSKIKNKYIITVRKSKPIHTISS